MKKNYAAPDIEFESFSLSVSIASCAIEAEHNTEGICGYQWDPETKVFLSGISGCDVPIADENDPTNIYNTICYHNPTDDKKLFGS